MAKKIVTDLQVEGKKVLVRVDFNVPLKDGVITDDNRIVQALPTIKYLIDHNAKVILFSHLGKVKSEEDKAKLSLRPVAERLSELLGKPVTFVPETRGKSSSNIGCNTLLRKHCSNVTIDQTLCWSRTTLSSNLRL